MSAKTKSLAKRAKAPKKDTLMKYTITYAEKDWDKSNCVMLCIEAHDEHDAAIIIRNIEEHFGGVTVAVDEEIPPKKKKRINSDRRKT